MTDIVAPAWIIVYGGNGRPVYVVHEGGEKLLCNPYDEIERLRAALALGLRMQDAQRAYFKTRTREALAASLEIEREFAQTARALLKNTLSPSVHAQADKSCKLDRAERALLTGGKR